MKSVSGQVHSDTFEFVFLLLSHVITEHLWTTLANRLPHPDNVRVSMPRKKGSSKILFVYLYCQDLHKSGCIFHGFRLNLESIPFNFSTGQLRYIDKEIIKLINKNRVGSVCLLHGIGVYTKIWFLQTCIFSLQTPKPYFGHISTTH